MLKHLLAFVLGALLAGAFWSWLDSEEEGVSPEAPSEVPAEGVSPDPVKLEEATEPRRSAPGARAEAERVPVEDEPLITAALLAYAREGIRQAWNERRSEPIPSALEEELLAQFKDQVLALPGYLGRDAAEKADEHDRALEDARTGGAQALLATLDDGGGPVFDLAEDNTRFGELFQRDVEPNFVDGPSLHPWEHPPLDGATLTFPAGVFETPDILRAWSARGRMPRDITIKGAGKDHTLFVGELQGARSDIRNLTLVGFTLHTNGGYFIDQRRDGMVLKMTDVRVTGFDIGAGSSCAFGTATLALHAERCEFLGGYGSSPVHGRLFDVRTSGLVARFDRCIVDLTSLGYSYHDGTVLFRQCELTRILDGPERWQSAAVRLDRSPIGFLSKDGEWRQGLQRDLNDLFPDWRALLER